MKKLLLFTFALLFVSALYSRPVYVQNMLSGSNYTIGTDTLELYDTLMNKLNNTTIRVTGSDPAVEALISHIWVKNTTDTEMTNVFVRRSMNQEVENTTNSFCFGIQCYPPWVNESAVADTAKIGILNKSFVADYYPDGHGGLSSITYEFSDLITFGVPVVAKVTIEFHISATGINEDKMVFKGPFPNPASQSTSFEYNLPASHSNAALIIRNMLGVEIENTLLENRSGKKSIDVSDYASGIYFYTLVVDGKIVQSKKLIVKH
jgi:hypothetical protein